MISIRSSVSSIRLLAPILGLLFSGCLLARPDPGSLPVQQACLVAAEQATPIRIEIARTPAQRSRGLMQRAWLAPDAGMLFVYRDQRRADQSFWMYQTLIPLDIAYLDRDGVILNIRQMTPCPAEQAKDCPTYAAGVPYYLALEMNLGYFDNHGFEAGDRLSLDPSDCRSVPSG